ncbi:MAG: FlgD immunoglobulin-like domain containing protein [bacterium]
MRIESRFNSDVDAGVLPDNGSGLAASDMIFYVNGINGNNGNLHSNPKAVDIGINNLIKANFYAPNGSIWLKLNTNATGAFFAKDVQVGINVQVTLDSYFGSGAASLAKSGDAGSSPSENLLTSSAPESYALEQNYPNPFNPSTVINFQLPVDGKVKLAIYSITGQLVQELVNEEMPAGRQAINWNGRNQAGEIVAAGMYLYRLIVRSSNGEAVFSETRRMTFLK